MSQFDITYQNTHNPIAKIGFDTEKNEVCWSGKVIFEVIPYSKEYYRLYLSAHGNSLQHVTTFNKKEILQLIEALNLIAKSNGWV